MPPFELALTRTPTTTSLQDMPRDEEMDPKTEKQAMLERLKTLRVRADGKLSAAQTRYKTDYDRGVTRKKNAQLREGDLVYVKVEITEVGRSHKLDSLVHGPYRVIENAEHTFRLQMGPDIVRISSDRITAAPPEKESMPRGEYGPQIAPLEGPTPSSRTKDAVASRATEVSPPRADVRLRPNGESDRLATATPEPELSPRGEYGPPVAQPGGPMPSQRMNNAETPRATESSSPPADVLPCPDRESGTAPRRETPGRDGQRPTRAVRKNVRWAPEVGKQTRSREEFAIERIVDAQYGEDGENLCRVRWVGYTPEEDTWELASNLPPHFLRRYENAKRRKLRGALLIEKLSRAGVGPWF
jgi:hypothetical protein